MKKADTRDDVVYSNLVYILPALFAPTYAGRVILSLTGAALVGGSAVYCSRAVDRVGVGAAPSGSDRVLAVSLAH